MNLFSRQITEHVKLCAQCARNGSGGGCRTGVMRRFEALNRGRSYAEVDEAHALGQTLFMLRKVDP